MTLALSLREGNGVNETEMLGLPLTESETLGVSLREGDGVNETEMLELPLTESETLGVSLREEVAESVGLALREGDKEGVEVTLLHTPSTLSQVAELPTYPAGREEQLIT